jgi:hypothetical protein
MGLFAPWFLAGLAGVALPLYLHLLKKLKTTPKPVPSLMFYESRTISSTHHRRLRYYLLLALRLAFLVLLILAFANPFINRDATAFANNRLVLLVIDNSFSMRAGTRLADAQAAAMRVLASRGAARAQVAAFGTDLHPRCAPLFKQSSQATATAISPNCRARCDRWRKRCALRSSCIYSAICSAANWREHSPTWRCRETYS